MLVTIAVEAGKYFKTIDLIYKSKIENLKKVLIKIMNLKIRYKK